MQQLSLPKRMLLVGTAALSLCFLPQSARADSLHTVLDNHEITFSVAPVVENQRTLVQARVLLESLGAKVDWDQATLTVTATLGTTVIKATIGDRIAHVNGKAVEMEVAPRIVEQSTFIPLRFFSQTLGLTVGWDQPTTTITIASRRSAEPSRDGSTLNRTAAAVVDTAKQLKGTAYAWGGTSPSAGFDCSGFTYYLGRRFGVDLPRTSKEQFQIGVSVSKANLLPGDLVFFETYEAGASHVGIYIGDGSFIHSQNENTGVIITKLSSAYWAQRYLGGRRVFR